MRGFLETVCDALLLYRKFSSDAEATCRGQNSGKAGRAEMHVLFTRKQELSQLKGTHIMSSYIGRSAEPALTFPRVVCGSPE